MRIRTIRCLAILVVLLTALPSPSANAGDKTWTSGGPLGGAVDALAISPAFAVDRTLFAGTNGGGIYKTTDAGATWYPISKGLISLVVYSIAISPNYPSDHTLVAGTNYTGLYRSTDGGQTWVQAPAPMNDKEVECEAFSPNYSVDRTIFAATNCGVYRSTDGGASWALVATGMTNTFAYRVAFSPNYVSDRTVFAGTDGGVFRSTDGGDTWVSANSGITTSSIRAIAFSPAFQSDRTMYAGTASQGIFRSTNGGDSWQAINVGHSPQKDVWSIMVSPNFAADNTLFTGCPSWQGFKSTNRGDTWTMYQFDIDHIDEGNRILPDVWAMAISPSFATDRTIFAGCFGGGVLRSVDGGTTWALMRTGMRAQRVMTVAASPNFSNDRTVYAGMNGGGIFVSNDGGITWHSRCAQTFSLMDTYALALSPNFSVDHTLFAGNALGQGPGRNGISRSTDGGITWTNPETGLENKNIRALAISPAFATDGTVFAGTLCWDFACTDPLVSGIFKSVDRGDTWFRSMNGLPKKFVYAITLSPDFSRDQTMFAGMWEGGVSKSTDGGANWVSANNGLLDNRVWAIAVSPGFSTDHTVFAGTEKGLFRSTDAGASWTRLTYLIWTRRISSIALSPAYPVDHTLYVGSNYEGVFVSKDSGETFASFSSGMGHTYVNALILTSGANATLFAGTSGGSVWQYSLSGGPWVQDMAPGWQLVSVPRAAANTDPGSLLSSISGHYSAVVLYLASDLSDPWKRYEPDWWLSDKLALTPGQGFWVYITSPATLMLDAPTPTTTTIPLEPGWNMIGYPAGAPRAVMQVLAAIWDKVDLVYGYGGRADNPWQRYDPDGPPWANTLEYMQPGLGYWIRVTAACTLTITY